MDEELEKGGKIEDTADGDITKHQKQRSRKKLLRKSLRKQMEFYFSDVNLSRDRMMNQLLSESPEIDLNIFFRFNKIKTMTSDMKDLVKSIESSKMLKVTECGTKVYRYTPILEKQNSDQCTIYVENVPADADHSFLINAFKAYGEIDYVSIPRFKHSGKNKGFAFVEFKKPESVQNAIATFAELGSCLSNQMEPGKLCSVVTYNEDKQASVDCSKMQTNEQGIDEDEKKEEKDIELKELPDSEFTVPLNEEGDKTVIDTNKKSRKRKASYENEKAKKCEFKKEEHDVESKLETDINKEDNIKTLKDIGNGNKRRKRRRTNSESDELPVKKVKENSATETSSTEKSDAETEGKSETEMVGGDEGNKKHKKERLLSGGSDGSEKPKRKKYSSFSSEDEAGLKSKRKTKKVNEENLKELDENGCEDVNPPEVSTHDDTAEEAENEEMKLERKKKKHRKRKKKTRKDKVCMGLQILTKQEWKRLRNSYLGEQRKKMQALKQRLRESRWENYDQCRYQSASEMPMDNTPQDENGPKDSTKVQGKQTSTPRVSYAPGLIVKVTMNEPIINITSFKNEARLHSEVKYIDIKEGSNVAFIRLSTAEAAEKFNQTSTWQGTEILTGPEEKEYWDKLWKDREEKIQKNIRTSKKGREKLLKKADEIRAKHMWFDDR